MPGWVSDPPMNTVRCLGLSPTFAASGAHDPPDSVLKGLVQPPFQKMASFDHFLQCRLQKWAAGFPRGHATYPAFDHTHTHLRSEHHLHRAHAALRPAAQRPTIPKVKLCSTEPWMLSACVRSVRTTHASQVAFRVRCSSSAERVRCMMNACMHRIAHNNELNGLHYGMDHMHVHGGML